MESDAHVAVHNFLAAARQAAACRAVWVTYATEALSRSPRNVNIFELTRRLLSGALAPSRLVLTRVGLYPFGDDALAPFVASSTYSAPLLTAVTTLLASLSEGAPEELLLEVDLGRAPRSYRLVFADVDADATSRLYLLLALVDAIEVWTWTHGTAPDTPRALALLILNECETGGPFRSVLYGRLLPLLTPGPLLQLPRRVPDGLLHTVVGALLGGGSHPRRVARLVRAACLPFTLDLLKPGHRRYYGALVTSALELSPVLDTLTPGHLVVITDAESGRHAAFPPGVAVAALGLAVAAWRTEGAFRDEEEEDLPTPLWFGLSILQGTLWAGFLRPSALRSPCRSPCRRAPLPSTSTRGGTQSSITPQAAAVAWLTAYHLLRAAGEPEPRSRATAAAAAAALRDGDPPSAAPLRARLWSQLHGLDEVYTSQYSSTYSGCVCVWGTASSTTACTTSWYVSPSVTAPAGRAWTCLHLDASHTTLTAPLRARDALVLSAATHCHTRRRRGVPDDVTWGLLAPVAVRLWLTEQHRLVARWVASLFPQTRACNWVDVPPSYIAALSPLLAALDTLSLPPRDALEALLSYFAGHAAPRAGTCDPLAAYTSLARCVEVGDAGGCATALTTLQLPAQDPGVDVRPSCPSDASAPLPDVWRSLDAALSAALTGVTLGSFSVTEAVPLMQMFTFLECTARYVSLTTVSDGEAVALQRAVNLALPVASLADGRLVTVLDAVPAGRAYNLEAHEEGPLCGADAGLLTWLRSVCH